MRYLNRFLFAAVVVAGSTGLSLAQQGGLGGGSPGGGLGGQGGGGLGGQGGGGQGGGALGGQQLQGAPLLQQETAPPITAPGTTTGGAAGGVMDASNPFGTFYANPYYAGTWANSKAKSNPGGFGQTLYGTTGGGGGIGAAGGATGGRMGTTGGLRTGTTTGLGGAGLGGRAGGLGGMNSATNQTGQVIALPAQIAYPAFPAFRPAPIAAPQLQADISGMIGRSVGTIANPAGVQVVTEGNNVMLRGAARDADEARLIEGMIRLTPGVRDVRNELTFPNPTGLPAAPMPGANSPPGYGLPSAPPVPGATPLTPTGFAVPTPVRLPGATVGTLTPPSR